MARSKEFCTSREFYCYSLEAASEEDERDIMAFEPIDPKGAGLVEYLQHFAFADEAAGVMRTYLVRDRVSDELVGYFSLKAGLVSLNEDWAGERVEFDTLPGIELANFAINASYLSRHNDMKGCGKAIFCDLILEVVKRASAIVGVCMLYLFSLPKDKVIANYERYGFHRMEPADEEAVHARLKPRYDARCVFMITML